MNEIYWIILWYFGIGLGFLEAIKWVRNKWRVPPLVPNRYDTGFKRLAGHHSVSTCACMEEKEMTDTLDIVREFNEAFDLPVADLPTMPRPDVDTLSYLRNYSDRIAEMAATMLADARGDDSGLLMRLHLCVEELGELAEAMAERDAVAALDALCDMRYVADGAALHLGLGAIFGEAMTEVHASNMSKLVDGKPVKNDAGRVLKPDTYFKPELAALVYGGVPAKGNFDGQPEAPNAFREPETFDQYLERTLKDSGLRSYGHNKISDGLAEQMCYQRALGCFYGDDACAPQGDEGPPWGIHCPEGEDAPHAAALAGDKALLPTPNLGPKLNAWMDDLPPVDQAITYAFGDATREFVKNHVERSLHHLKSISTLLDAAHKEPV